MTTILGKVYDHRRSDSWSANLRKKRLSLFKSLIAPLPQPLKILDVGGTEGFWQQAGFLEQEGNIKITAININPIQVKVNHPNFKFIAGDARDMKQFENNEFDVVFSNSVIEHVGNYNDQLRMANEIMRIGKKYFVQTPNLYFPIEPHYVFPLFQFLPLELKAWLLTHFDMGWHKKTSDKEHAKEKANSIRLLTKKEMLALFPDSKLFEEKVFGLTKSFIVYG